MNLVIVESPAKAKTIEKYLGVGYKVLASFGHVRDLPQKELGVDVAHDYTPTYESIDKSKKVLAEIKKNEKGADLLYLATDLDREGEAISWHLLQALKIKNDDKRVKRIVFSEITKSAIDNAIKHPRSIDQHLVDAQQARRILDRLVGYKLSPLLWRKVKSGLSAGRVQSVAVRLVVDREREIEKFKAEEYWVLGVILSKQKTDATFKALLIECDGKSIKKSDITSEKQARELVKRLEKAKYTVVSVEKKEQTRKASAPFTTSTLQMEASRKLGYSAKQTMRYAQGLYEDGHITYMRTDSTNLSQGAVTEIRKLIKSDFGDKYLPATSPVFQTKTKRAQEAHEAIRPSVVASKQVADDPGQQKLYDLIWKRAVASQMNDARFDITTAIIEAKTDKKFRFLTSGESLVFDGFMKLYIESRDDEIEEESNLIPSLSVNEVVDYKDLIKDQKFTEPPKRYSEAMLVKKLEALGIGRPSTYAPTLGTIQDRGYVVLDNKRFSPTEIATIVNDLLVAHFPVIVDFQFTAKMENEFDEIASGDVDWVKMIDEFYQPFAKNLSVKMRELEKNDIMKPEPTGEKCPECGEPLVLRIGRFGKFIACSNYPKCKFSKPQENKNDEIAGKDGKVESAADAIEEKCEKCGGKMIMKEGRFGKFLACENYPKCKNTKTILKTINMKCPECGKGEIVEKRTKRGKSFWGCSAYPGCKYASWDDPTKQKDEAKPEDNEESKSE